MPKLYSVFRNAKRRRRTVRSKRVARSVGRARRTGLRRSRVRGRQMVGRPKFVLYNRLLQPKVITKLTYCDTKTLAGSSGSIGHWWRLNSIFDPDQTGGGHQPAFHDQWANLYQSYRVLATTWTLRFIPARQINTIQIASGGTALGETHAVSDDSHSDQIFNPCILATEINDNASTVYTETADLNFIRETGYKMRNVKFGLCPGKPNTYFTIKGGCRHSNILDNPAESNDSTSFGSNPSYPTYMRMVKMSKDGNYVGEYKVDVRFNFIVELSDPVDVGES